MSRAFAGLAASAAVLAWLAAPALAAEPSPAGPAEFVPGELLVQFERGTSRAESAAIARDEGARVIERAKIVPRLTLLDLPDGLGVGRADRLFSSLDEVKRAEPNFVHRVSQQNFPNEQTDQPVHFNNLWGLDNVGQAVNPPDMPGFAPSPSLSGTPDADIDAPEAWDTQTGTSTTTVAVIDTGLALAHPDIADNVWVNLDEAGGTAGVDDDVPPNGHIDDLNGWDFVELDKTPDDVNTHGTHVAGTIGAVGNNSIGITGVNWDVSLMALKAGTAEGSLTTARVIDAVEYADGEMAHVINASFGGGAFSTLERDAIAAFDGLFVAAAGNDATNVDLDPEYPCDYELANVICVAATNQFDNLTSFSNFGQGSVDLAAPGNYTYSTVPAFTTPFSDDFEDPDDFAATWTTGGTDGTWSRITATTKDFTPTHVMTDSAPVGTNYLPNANHWVQTIAPVSLTTDCRVTAGIDYELAAGDSLFIEASTTPAIPASWMQLGSPIVGVGRASVVRAIPDSPFEGSLTFHLRFRIQSTFSSVDDGAYVDDVKIECVNPTAEAYGFKNGTSMASPHVAGSAALLRAANPSPSYTVANLRSALLNNVDQLSSLACRLATGGRLNVNNAIQPGAETASLVSNCPPQPQAAVAPVEEEEHRCGGKRATIVGTGKKDTIKGTQGADVIVGLGGSDTIRGKGGNDRLCGNDGKDRLIGGGGKDKLFGGAGKDFQQQ